MKTVESRTKETEYFKALPKKSFLVRAVFKIDLVSSVFTRSIAISIERLDTKTMQDLLGLLYRPGLRF